MTKHTSKRPILLFVLDILGAIIAAIGIIEYLDSGSISSALLVLSGLILMLPLIIHILKLLPVVNAGSGKSEGDN